MHLRVVLRTILLLVISCIGSGCAQNKRVSTESLPPAILKDSDFFIGQSLNVLLEKKKVRLDESSHCYCGRDSFQTIFTNICVNCSISGENVTSLTLDGSVRAYSEYIDSEMIALVKILDSTYGVTTEIYDDSYFVTSDSLSCPRLIWRTEKRNIVTLVFTPKIWKKSCTAAGEYAINFASLTISTPENATLSLFQRSKIWNRTLLGLNE